MEILHRRAAGLDVHSRQVTACVRVQEGSRIEREVQEFATSTRGLLELRDWLAERGVTHVAMESTGVYWKPVWHVLEAGFELVLGNAREIRNVPGRKTDVNDATWIADLLAHGLIRASFVPPTPIQELRDLTRTRKQLVREIARHTQRIQKTLEDANVKLSGVVSDVLGTSGRAMLEAMVAGEADPERLVTLARGRLRDKRGELIEALHGRVRDHHRFMLRLHLRQIDALRAGVSELETRIGGLLEPFRGAFEQLMTIPGVGPTVAAVLLAEVGPDLSRFPSAGHLLSWARLCPRNDESAGKRRSTRTLPGANWLKPVLVQAAWVAVRKRDSYLAAQYQRIRARRGAKKAIVAVAASILTAAYHMLVTQTSYRDLGPDHFDHRNRVRQINHLIRRLEHLGLQVDVRPAA